MLPLLFLLMGELGLRGGAVYIDRESLRNRWWQSAVSAAGPIANIGLAVLLSIIFKLAIGNDLAVIDRLDGESFLLDSLEIANESIDCLLVLGSNIHIERSNGIGRKLFMISNAIAEREHWTH